MTEEKLQDLIKQYHEHREFITNEETAKMALVVPFTRCLGYDPNNPREVRLEYTAEFTQADGKRLRDRMDFAIFDKDGKKPLIVIETKPLGTDLQKSSHQLARYLAQMPDLHFGIITDGCHYLFFGDLDAPNQMDREPFFSFSLDDPDMDLAKVAKFLSKFSRESFNSETLVTDAEDSRYRQAMIEKVSTALAAPAEDDAFMEWLTRDIYKGKRTSAVMTRFGKIAEEAIEPALVRVMSNEFLEKLKERMLQLQETADKEDQQTVAIEDEPTQEIQSAPDVDTQPRRGIETTEEELEFHQVVRDICVKESIPADDILFKDTVHYFNVSYQRPTKWFLRFFGSTTRKNITTHVPADEARQLAQEFEVEDSPNVFGVSRVYIENVAQLWALKDLIIRSLEIVKAAKERAAGDGEQP